MFPRSHNPGFYDRVLAAFREEYVRRYGAGSTMTGTPCLWAMATMPRPTVAILETRISAASDSTKRHVDSGRGLPLSAIVHHLASGLRHG